MIYKVLLLATCFYNIFGYGFKQTCPKITWMPQKDYTWNWMDTTVNYKYIPCENPYTNKDKQAILFIHGFGANCYHWRHNMIQLSQHYDMYSIDLLGFGKSGKPLEMDYTFDLWSSQILEFVETVIEKNTFLVGNSLINTVSLQAGYCKWSCVNKSIWKIQLGTRKGYPNFYDSSYSHTSSW